MKQLICKGLWGGLLITLAIGQVSADPPVSKAVTGEKQASITPQRALELLKEGNQRFLNDALRSYNYRKEMKVTARMGQFPIAIILNCIDSRSIADILFDQGLGNVFVSRIAGNVVDTTVLGGMEFATEHAGASLIVVMGHTRCGAVQGACAGGASGNLKRLLEHIQPAVKTILSGNHAAKDCNNPETIDTIAKQNVINQVQLITKNSPAIEKMVKDKKIMVIGAMHNIKTGDVAFFDGNGSAL